MRPGAELGSQRDLQCRSGEGASVAEVVSRIKDTVAADLPGAPEALFTGPLYRPGRDFDVPRVVLDITRARRDFGWSPKIVLPEGLAQSWAWVRQAARMGEGGKS